MHFSKNRDDTFYCQSLNKKTKWVCQKIEDYLKEQEELAKIELHEDHVESSEDSYRQHSFIGFVEKNGFSNGAKQLQAIFKSIIEKSVENSIENGVGAKFVPLPKTLDTLRLFGVVILHVNLRKKIMESNHSIQFFLNLLQINSVGVCNAVCNIMKRLPLTEEYVASLSSSGFLSGYFRVVPEVNDKSVQLSALRLLDTLARVRFVPEFMTMIEFVVKLCNSGGELAFEAGTTGGFPPARG